MSESFNEWSKKLVGKKFLESGKQGENVLLIFFNFKL